MVKTLLYAKLLKYLEPDMKNLFIISKEIEIFQIPKDSKSELILVFNFFYLSITQFQIFIGLSLLTLKITILYLLQVSK